MTSGINYTAVFLNNDAISFSNRPTAGVNGQLVASNVLRDPSAWYHIVAVFDSANPTASNRMLLYINGTQVTSFTTSTYPSISGASIANSAISHYVGADGTGNYLDGYLAEVNFIDGQALTPSSFGQIESTTGVWSPKPYAGSYGTNGFYLKFGNTSSVAALGTDSSGNNNTWTVNNVSLTAGATYDSMFDVPVNYSDGGNGRGNYAVLNPTNQLIVAGSGGSVISQGNLASTGPASANSGSFYPSTIAMSSGKWYAECAVVAVGTANSNFGIVPSSLARSWSSSVSVLLSIFNSTSSNISRNGSVVQSSLAAWSNGDIAGLAIDLDAGTVQFYKNGSAYGSQVTSINAVEYVVGVYTSQDSLGSISAVNANFGQRPFQFPVPAGFRALNTNNLPTPTIVNGANFMAATTYLGNAAARSLSNAVNNVSFQPDLVWIKSRTPGATNHALFDSSRGVTKYLSSNTTTTETTLAQSLTAINADGFSLGTDTTLVNASANSYVAWQWKAGGAAVSNTQGTITSQVSANTTAGFSVVTWVGNLTSGATVGHSLGVAPKLIIFFNRSIVGERPVYSSVIGAANYLYINAVNGSAAFTGFFNNTAPTASVFSLGNDARTNGSGNNLVAYCFAEIAGFSKFGSYTGNGSADGPFVFCGFRPRFVMVKNTTNAYDWVIYDTSRDITNVCSDRIYPNAATVLSSQAGFDVLSNGFKIRNDNSYQQVNQTSANYIYAAFAEVPSKYALAR
jgi:hypothetical protein